MKLLFQWPFIRTFGLQEPASVLFSLLNFYAHVKMYNSFRKNVHPSAPMFYVWTYFMTVRQIKFNDTTYFPSD